MVIWREIGGVRGGPSQTAAPEQTKSGYEIAGRLGGFATRAVAARLGGGRLKGACRSWQSLANGRPEIIVWREIGGFRVGPSQTAAPEQTRSGYGIARHLGGCVARAGPPRRGGGGAQRC